MIENRATSEPDVILVGAGIMSATLGVFLKELEPGLNISTNRRPRVLDRKKLAAFSALGGAVPAALMKA